MMIKAKCHVIHREPWFGVIPFPLLTLDLTHIYKNTRETAGWKTKNLIIIHI